ncbi:hypothetical protein sos41_27710 [Alphaproteobacteria bacterium SO-S41]|nr:hypothetical protein sos41_27710 [Alphaproteobacteria bacterium SO-S41]
MTLSALRCSFPAWIVAWAMGVFGSSALIAYFGLSAPAALIGTGFDRLPATTWAVGDEVGPVAKLLFGALLALAFFATQRLSPDRAPIRYCANAVAGIAAMAGALALIPADYSRGFGIGLTGARFDPASLPLYVISAAAVGLVFTAALRTCQRRRRAIDTTRRIH